MDLDTGESAEHLESGVVRVVARGEIDFDSAEVLSTRLSSLIDHGASVIVLDAGEVTFLDSSGLRVIIAAANRLRALGGQLFIEGMSGAVQRVLEITGLLDRLVFSGDKVYKDENGFIYFVARADDMIKTKGFRVSPTEVESEVLRHPEVVEAVAFAVPNISVGEDVACAYTSANGKPIAETELKQFLKSQLPNHMVPAILLHFDSFPILGNYRPC